MDRLKNTAINLYKQQGEEGPLMWIMPLNLHVNQADLCICHFHTQKHDFCFLGIRLIICDDICG